MIYLNKKEPFILFLGDLFILLDSLWISILIRNLEIPKDLINSDLFWSFSILSLFWILSFYVAGLYQKHTIVLKNKLPNLLFKTQIANVVLAITFFYFIPYFHVTPKTILFIYLFVSSILIYVWRVYIFKLIKPFKKQAAILIAEGDDMKKLVHEVNNNSRYGYSIVNIVDLSQNTNPNIEKVLADKIKEHGVEIVIVDLINPKIEDLLPKLYNMIFSKIELIDFQDVFEEIFDQVPLSSVNYTWFINNIKIKRNIVYGLAKRLGDIIMSLIMIIPSLILYPFVMLAIYLETKASPFIIQERIGKDNNVIKIIKFRSMVINDSGKWPTINDERITKVGKILRATRIDELPQLLNVLCGKLSLVGPRPDIVGLFNNLNREIKYYQIRNVVKPGLSGWAQTHQDAPPHSIEETRKRLAYDLYYIKNRSLMLDLKITLQTFRILLSRSGK